MKEVNLSNLGLSEKEEKILESAIMIFSKKGFSASTTKEIAKKAGVAEGTIFKYFKTKKNIMKEIVIQLIKVLSKTVILGSIEKILLDEKEEDMKKIFKKVFYDRLKFVDSFFPMAKVVFTEAMMHEEVRDAIYENIISRAANMFMELRSRMIKRGFLRDDIEPLVMFRALFANIAVLIFQKKLFGDKFNIDDNNLDKELDKSLEVILYGIAKR